MLFTSKEFLLLLSLTFLVYYIPAFKKIQVWTLVLASFVFYAFSQPLLLTLLISSILINSICSYLIIYGFPSQRKSIAMAGVIINLFVIVFFKYSGMLSSTFNFPGEIGMFLLTLPLPLGISFFTFEGISLLVDTFKSSDKKEVDSIIAPTFFSHLRNTLLFVSFFPHLIAGPILKANEYYPQIASKYFNAINWDKAFRQLILGYFLKTVIADNIKDQTFNIAYPHFVADSTITLVSMLFGYSIQIFADFAGYSLIALGLATLFGYELKDNFNHPYLSTSFAEFWTRWHISLSSFLKEYLYIPLGGNRKGKIRTYFNLFITMFLGGLWHGAGWSYAIWGLAHGTFLAVERLVKDKFIFKLLPQFRFLNWVLVFSLVSLAWLLFKLPDISHVYAYLKAMSANFSIKPDYKRILLILTYSLPVIIYSTIGFLNENRKWENYKKYEWLVYGTLLFLLITNRGISTDFIYFQF
jgi:alginate O-acetyltransferase complex protein AlgI